ncbi:heterokaryon incompatibility protein-domain-containing protein, partial [Pseudomassariella vexata]
CLEEHDHCLSRDSSALPDRVLDLGTPCDPHLKLLETQNEPAEYVSLSYCWGTLPNFVTLTSNIEEFKAGIDETTLPATLKDTVAVTRALGIRYLWIDAICIIQRDAEDWNKQSVKMASVYGNAYLTLIISQAEGVHDGFLHKRDNTTLAVGTTQKKGQDTEVYLLPRVATADEILQDLSLTPVGDRGWCVQERLIAPRKVYFHRDQMIWECKERFYCE